MAIKIGDKVLVSVPSVITQPFSGWASGWIRMIEDIDGREVKVIDENSTLCEEKGIKFDKEGRWSGIIPFIPIQWVKDNSLHTVPFLTNSPNGRSGHNSEVVKPSYMYCATCGGYQKHRLMCPANKIRS